MLLYYTFSQNESNNNAPSGGLSNSLFCCTLPDNVQTITGEPSQVLLRLYGNHLRNGNVSMQLKIFKILSIKNLGPKLYGDFEDGRLEEYLPASSLTAKELRDTQVSAVIAKRLATIHNLDVPLKKDKSWLVDKFDEYTEYITDNIKLFLNLDLRSSTRKMAGQILSIDFNEEIRFLNDLLARSNSPLVFSHNDLHQGNILLTEACKNRSSLAERIVFIDFEFCSYNYRAFDIANHFCEYCFDYDTPNYPFFNASLERFPSKADQLVFLRHYFDQFVKTRSFKSSSNGIHNSNSMNSCSNSNKHEVGMQHRASLESATSFSGESALLDEIKPFILASHLLWILWSIKNALCSPIKFGYWVCMLF